MKCQKREKDNYCMILLICRPKKQNNKCASNRKGLADTQKQTGSHQMRVGISSKEAVGWDLLRY